MPAPIDLQLIGNDLQANRKYANELWSRIKQIPGIADARIQQAFQQPTLNVNVNRSLAGLVGLSEKDAATAMQTTLAGSSQTSPTYWLSIPRGGLLSGLDPDATAQSRHDERAENYPSIAAWTAGQCVTRFGRVTRKCFSGVSIS